MENVLSYKLESFEGPLDLLLQLLAKNKLNIYDIPLSVLVEQYLEQINAMRDADMDIASEFLEMAARLLHMKTVSLLPKHEEIEELKADLAGELLEYELCRKIAAQLQAMGQGFDLTVRTPSELDFPKTYALTHDSETLVNAYLAAVGRGKRRLPPPQAAFDRIVAKKIVSVSSKIVYVMRKLWKGGKNKLSSLYHGAKSRSEIIATFLAVLELCKNNRVRVEGEAENTTVTLLKEKKEK